MLLADKNQTLTDFQHQTLEIREKELNYFVALYNGISGIAAMMAGFGFGSLKIEFPDSTSYMLQIAYLTITASAIGLELLAILNAATCSVFGPGKFLRGKDGLASANQAVSVLEEKSEITLQYFLMGFGCIIISSSLKAFILHSFFNALIVSCGLLAVSFYLLTVGQRIIDRLYVEKKQAISGLIQGDQVIDPTDAKL
mmetsp:Transcript_1036/g.1885  ORF Transcript_1036/g.1885 Transcript_1036/m.1885 type:complete len:198 (+) Transcript_1036:28-621(+)